MKQTINEMLLGLVICALSISNTQAIPPGMVDERPTMDAPFLSSPITPRKMNIIGPSLNASMVDDCSSQVFTGDDVCDTASNHLITVGAIGSPGMVTISGDSTAVSGPDSCNLAMWWESFTIDAQADVTIDFCCSGGSAQMFNVVFAACPVGNNCTGFIFNDSEGIGTPVCGDSSEWNIFNSLAAGTYYIPISTTGPYQMHIAAAEPSGSCCNLSDGTCAEGQSESQCSALFANSQWNVGLSCVFAECDVPGPSGFASKDVTLLSHVGFSAFADNPTAANDVWSYVSPSGREYAIIGLECSVGVVEVTNPVNPVVIGTISGPCSLWRDMKMHGEFAYNVIDQTGNGLQVIDLTQVDNGIISLAATSVLDGFLSTSHNIAYNPDSGFLYLGLTNRNGGLGLTAIDATDPVNPVIAGEWIPTNGMRCHDLHIITYDTGIYAGREIAFCFGEGLGFAVVDVSDKQNMFQMSARTYPNVTYCHQGWTTEDRKFLFFGDELDETNDPDVIDTTTYVFNIENLNNPQLVTTFTNGKASIDHNLIIRGDRAYEANYSTGMRVFDISNPFNPMEVGFFDTSPEDNSQAFVGLWGVDPSLPSGIILVSDDVRGLFVLRDDTAGPVARYTPSIGVPMVGQAITYDGSLSMHPTPPRTIVSYDWDFSYDGITFNVEASGMVVAHTFSSVGTFSVALRVTDDDGVAKTNLISKDAIVALSLFAPAALPGEPGFNKDRYVSIDSTTNVGEQVATQVTRVGSANNQYVDCTSLADKGADGLYARLIDGPLPPPGNATYYCDLNVASNGLHIRGCSIVPGNSYDITMTIDGTTFSPVLSISTTPPQVPTREFGDVLGVFNGASWTAPDGVVTTNDIVGVIKKFVFEPGAPIIARVDNDGDIPNSQITSGDVLRAVLGFAGSAFGSGVTGCLTGTCVPNCP